MPSQDLRGVDNMRIDGIQKVAQIYSSNGTVKAEKKSKAAKQDHVQISQAGRDFQIARDAVKNAPDVREDIVADIKGRIEAGTYEVSGDAFAEKVISRYNQMMI